MDDYKYLAITDWCKNYISEQQLQVGDRFLSENEISIMHNVSRQTVRQALKVLEDENVISRIRGSGTFVKSVSTDIVDCSKPISVGIISTYFSDYIFPSIITGLESVLRRNNIGIQLSTTHNRVFEEAQAIRNMIAHGVSGLIIEPSKSALPNPNMALYEELRAKNIPMVFFNAKYPWQGLSSVTMDDICAGKLVTDYLFDCGHKNISAIFSLDDMQGHNRYRGFMESCENHRVMQAEQNVLWYSTGERGELFSLSDKRIMNLLKRSTAVVCYNDKLAVELMDFCKCKGIRVPEDVSITGIDNVHFASIYDVKLTTVTHPKQQLGEAAAKMLLELMADPKQQAREFVFTPELVVRDSVLRINNTDT